MTVIVNGDITQCDLPRGVRSGLSDALERFEEDEMVGIVRFGKEDCVRSALCQRTLHLHTVKCIIGAEPGRTGLCFGCLYPDQRFSETTIFICPWLVKCTLILWFL